MARTVVLLFLTLLCVLSFAHLTHEAWEQEVFPIDRATRAWMQDHQVPALARPMHAMSALGSGYALVPLCFAAFALFWMYDRGRAWIILLLPLASVVLEVLTKWLVHRPRPKGVGYGFPSGHVTVSVVFFGAVIYVLWASGLPRRWRWAASAAGGFVIIAIAYSRLYLNAHWLTDIVGGFTGGGASLLLGIGLTRMWPRQESTAKDSARVSPSSRNGAGGSMRPG